MSTNFYRDVNSSSTYRMVDENGIAVGVFDASNQYIRSKKQDAFYKRNVKAKYEFEDFNEDAGKFIWSYPDKVQFLIKSNNFTKSDLTMIFYLATYIDGTGYLSYGNKVKMQKADLQKVLGIGRNLFSKLYNKLIDHGILKKAERGYKWSETFNFYGSSKGIAKPTMLVRTYVNQIRGLYEATNEGGRRKYSATSLYPIFALVPYLHHSTNIVCKNPEVKHIEEIEYWNQTEIAVLLDLKNSKKMSSSISGLLLSGQTTFRQVRSKNEVYLQLNPRIFWRDVVAPDKNMVFEFDMVDNNRKKRKSR